jgi:hypothetical protein
LRFTRRSVNYNVTVRTVLPVIVPDVTVIVDLPTAPPKLANPLERPTSDISATDWFDDCQVAEDVRFVVVPSEINPIAVNCCTTENERLMTGLEGEIAIDTSTGAVTVRVARFDVMPDKAAVMVVVPCASVLTSPRVPVALLTVATWVFDDDQVAEAVTSCDVPSEKAPVAVYCSLFPAATLVVVGATEIEASVAGVTVSAATGEVTELNEARMLVVPAPFDSASPNEPAVFPTVATEGVEELQSAKVVRSWVSPPVSVPVAVNCCDVPSAMLAVAGDTAIEATAAEVSVAGPDIVPREAVMVADPVAPNTALAKPVPETVAVAASDDVQVTKLVKSCVAPFWSVPSALNWSVVPPAIVCTAGATAREARGDTVKTVEPETEPDLAVMFVDAVSPIFAAVASPVGLTAATVVSADSQVTPSLSLAVMLFEYVPIASS